MAEDSFDDHTGSLSLLMVQELSSFPQSRRVRCVTFKVNKTTIVEKSHDARQSWSCSLQAGQIHRSEHCNLPVGEATRTDSCFATDLASAYKIVQWIPSKPITAWLDQTNNQSGWSRRNVCLVPPASKLQVDSCRTTVAPWTQHPEYTKRYARKAPVFIWTQTNTLYICV